MKKQEVENLVALSLQKIIFNHKKELNSPLILKTFVFFSRAKKSPKSSIRIFIEYK
jgi:hypothetical protein